MAGWLVGWTDGWNEDGKMDRWIEDVVRLLKCTVLTTQKTCGNCCWQACK